MLKYHLQKTAVPLVNQKVELSANLKEKSGYNQLFLEQKGIKIGIRTIKDTLRFHLMVIATQLTKQLLN